MDDYLHGKVYTNYFGDIAPMILASDKYSPEHPWYRQNCKKSTCNQNQTRTTQIQQIQSEIYLHSKNNHYSAMAALKENHISSEWLKSGMRSHISQDTDANQIPIKTNKRSGHIVIKRINVQSLISKLDEIRLSIENEDLDILCISENLASTKHSRWFNKY